MSNLESVLKEAVKSPNKPYIVDVTKQWNKEVCYLRVKKSKEGSWNVASPGEMAVKVTLLSLEEVVVSPLLALASLVEGVLRALSGGTQFLLSFIPFTGNDVFRDKGRDIAWSATTNVFFFFVNAVETFVEPARAIWSAIDYSRDAYCSRVAERMPEARTVPVEE